MLKYILLALMLVAVAGAAMVRMRPIQPEKYHLDLAALLAKDVRGHFSVGANGDLPAAVFAETPAEVAAKLQEIIQATPRTTLLAGSLSSDESEPVQRATYVTRSAIWGFPDVTTIEIVQTDAGTQVSMFGRLVYGEADFGVNEARVKTWLLALEDSAT